MPNSNNFLMDICAVLFAALLLCNLFETAGAILTVVAIVAAGVGILKLLSPQTKQAAD